MLSADIYTGDGPAIPASAPAPNQFRLLDCDPWRPTEKVSAEFQKQMGRWTGCKRRILKETGLGNMHTPPSPRWYRAGKSVENEKKANFAYL